jgi:hypothetical protein
MEAYAVFIRCRKPKFEKRFTVKVDSVVDATKWGYRQAKEMGFPEAIVEVCKDAVPEAPK